MAIKLSVIHMSEPKLQVGIKQRCYKATYLAKSRRKEPIYVCGGGGGGGAVLHGHMTGDGTNAEAITWGNHN